ncbi:unnamed protein product [Spodoptera exigua]|nr:unnamed protein product [Spodoptera exigua]
MAVIVTQGGYTPLHIAMQFRHENVYRLLVEVYDADPNVRDWSGRKPRQYLVHMDTSLSPGSYRKKEGFLRIGSLNVRVKKTTEAFSNFLGVGATRSSAYVPKSAREERRSDDSDQLKSWGSADNIQPRAQIGFQTLDASKESYTIPVIDKSIIRLASKLELAGAVLKWFLLYLGANASCQTLYLRIVNSLPSIWVCICMSCMGTVLEAEAISCTPLIESQRATGIFNVDDEFYLNPRSRDEAWKK